LSPWQHVLVRIMILIFCQVIFLPLQQAKLDQAKLLRHKSIFLHQFLVRA
jgi:hypothetical protein